MARTPRPAARSAPAVEADSATARIVESITAAIVERRLLPGTKLAELKLAGIYGVSRTLVRQALHQLSRHHLVSLSPARGAQVATPGVDEARQVFQVRAVLEAALMRQLCNAMTKPQLAELRAHLREEAAAVARSDVPGRTRLLAHFHVLLARLSGNQVLAQILGDLLSRCSLIALMYQSSHSAQHSQTEHVQIVQALAQGQARTAIRLMHQHLNGVERSLRLAPHTTDLNAALRPEA